MSHSEFIKKYKELCTIYSTWQTLPMELLKLIHGYLFLGDTELRYRPEDLEYQRIQLELRRLYMMTKENMDIELYIRSVCQSIAVIHMYQPFFDGNTRTCLTLQEVVFEMKGMKFQLSEEEIRIDKNLIGILYNEDEEIGETVIKEIKKYITK